MTRLAIALFAALALSGCAVSTTRVIEACDPDAGPAIEPDAGALSVGGPPVCDLNAGEYSPRCGDRAMATCVNEYTRWYWGGAHFGCGLAPRRPLTCNDSGDLVCPAGFSPACVLGAEVTTAEGEIVWCEPPDWL